MAHDDSYFRLRIPDFLKDRIEAAANGSRRSMNAEILARLEQSFLSDERMPEIVERVGAAKDLMDDIDKRIDAAVEMALRRALVEQSRARKAGSENPE